MVAANGFAVTHGDVRIEGDEWRAADLDAPAVLLLAGTSCTRDWWPPRLCEMLASLGMRVVRFDQRDTGSSTTFPIGEPPYGLRDLVGDAIAVLDALEIGRAHLVGFSQGGWVAQLLAIEHADRVRALTLVSTRVSQHGPADAGLPEVTAGLLDAWGTLAEPDWSDRGAVIEFYVESERALAGVSFDEAAVRQVCSTAIDRSAVVQAASNHPMMVPTTPWRRALGRVTVPTAVLHGTVDPLFPVENAYALVAEIPGATLRLFDGVGHELPERVWPSLIDVVALGASGR